METDSSKIFPQNSCMRGKSHHTDIWEHCSCFELHQTLSIITLSDQAHANNQNQWLCLVPYQTLPPVISMVVCGGPESGSPEKWSHSRLQIPEAKILVHLTVLWKVVIRLHFVLVTGDVAQFVERQTGTLLRLVGFPGAARDFSPRVNFQCRLSYYVYTPFAIACINISVCIWKIL